MVLHHPAFRNQKGPRLGDSLRAGREEVSVHVGGPYLPGGAVPFALLHLTGEEAEFQKCWASAQGSRTNLRLSYSPLVRAMDSHTVLSPLTLKG